ncbi:MAG TPA: non-canonical purine NTP diphosphatase [Paludibacter sp.]|nr:non-canonical purine NTP diphosphatase [Paludibacter sp.]
MKKIVFATNNQHKLLEVRAVVGNEIEIISLAELNCFDDIAETGNTLEENALIKAKYINEKFGLDCMADDTGLEVEALGGEPGVFSARYAGEEQNSKNNMEKLLHNLKDINNRNACFRTVIAFIENSEIKYFDGIIKGEIIREPRGIAGFGYDPVFVPDGYSQTFAELGAEEKNRISHRALAVKKLADYLKQS